MNKKTVTFAPDTKFDSSSSSSSSTKQYEYYKFFMKICENKSIDKFLQIVEQEQSENNNNQEVIELKQMFSKFCNAQLDHYHKRYKKEHTYTITDPNINNLINKYNLLIDFC